MKYYRIEETPMKYVTVIQILCIIWFGSALFRIVQALTDEFDAYTLVFNIIRIALTIVVIAGLSKRKWSSVLAVYSQFAINILDGIIGLYFVISYNLDDSLFAFSIGQIFGASVWLILTVIYFQKRRPLYEPNDKFANEIQSYESSKKSGVEETEVFEDGDLVPILQYEEETKDKEGHAQFVDASLVPIDGSSVDEERNNPDSISVVSSGDKSLVSDNSNVSISDGINFCPICGTRVDKDAIYCIKCGMKVR